MLKAKNIVFPKLASRTQLPLNEKCDENSISMDRLLRHCHPRAETLEKEVTVVNYFGLHIRPAATFARLANRFRSKFRSHRMGPSFLS